MEYPGNIVTRFALDLNDPSVAYHTEHERGRYVVLILKSDPGSDATSVRNVVHGIYPVRSQND